MMTDKELQAIKDDLPAAVKNEDEILDTPWRKEDEIRIKDNKQLL